MTTRKGHWWLLKKLLKLISAYHWQGCQYRRYVDGYVFQIVLNSSMFITKWRFPLPGGCHSPYLSQFLIHHVPRQLQTIMWSFCFRLYLQAFKQGSQPVGCRSTCFGWVGVIARVHKTTFAPDVVILSLFKSSNIMRYEWRFCVNGFLLWTTGW